MRSGGLFKKLDTFFNFFTVSEKKAFCVLCLILLGGAGIRFFNIPQNLTFEPVKHVREVGKININTATFEELQLIPSVGPKIAQRIIEYRRVHGAITLYEDLQAIPGIGEKKIEIIKEYGEL